jgi:2-oxoglutarate dehydrogenase E1 component
VQGLVEERLKMVQGNPSEKKIDWGMGETLAYATLLWEGKHIRLSGQDSRRGTFSHRHSLWVDQQNAAKYFPLAHLKPDQGRFDVYNSPLSEFAVLGFEYGYSVAYSNALVIWEAQFGDFCNEAQVIIDQYITTAEQKWGRTSGLTLFLPHGYEGQGPEHSSARMERFLQLAGDANIQVVNPTTPAQLFHLLRRQALREIQKPLIVLTPKGLLRHPDCVSSCDELTSGVFEEVIDDPKRPKTIKKLIFCSGRIYYDLYAEREKCKADNIAFIRIEQLYPLHLEKLEKIIRSYQGYKECCWVQDEPSNMGAWDFIRHFLQQILEMKLLYIGRKRSASPAVGSHALHRYQYEAIINQVFEDVGK